MKKNLIPLLGITLAISCDNAALNGEKLSPDAQKEKLEATARMVMEECPASDFQEFSDFADFLTDQYFENQDYDLSAFENRYEELYNTFFSTKDNHGVLVLVLAQCTGEFAFGEKAATYTPSDKLTLKIADEQGRNYLVELKTSGEVKTIENYDIDELDITLKVPEKIEVLITRNGEMMASVEVSYKFRLHDNINPTEDMVEIYEKVTVKNYVISTACSYDAKSKLAKVNCRLTKGERLIVSHNASATVTLSGTTIPETNLVNVQNYSSDVDIMGAVQVTGYAPDYSKIRAIYDKIEYKSQASTEAAASEINRMLSLKLYYDGNITEQAHIEFESKKSHFQNTPAYPEQSENNVTVYYDVSPVIVFSDNSRYSAEEYFSEEMFENLINQFENYADMFVSLVDRFI